MKNKLTLMAGVAAALVGLCATTQAGPVLTLSDGVNTVSVNTPGGGGNYTYNGAVGAWNINVATGVSSGTATLPQLDLNDVSYFSSGENNTLTITWTVDGLGPLGGNFNAEVGGTLSGMTDQFSMLLNGSQVGGTLTYFTSPFAGTLSGNATAGGNDNSLTLKAVLTAKDGASSSFDYSVRVPDGGTTVLLLGAALSAIGLLRRKLAA